MISFVDFFSPSGLNNYRNNTHIDFVSYLPIDTQKNVKKFLKIVKPKIAIFIKSEFWFNFLNQLSLQKIQHYILRQISIKMILY